MSDLSNLQLLLTWEKDDLMWACLWFAASFWSDSLAAAPVCWMSPGWGGTGCLGGEGEGMRVNSCTPWDGSNGFACFQLPADLQFICKWQLKKEALCYSYSPSLKFIWQMSFQNKYFLLVQVCCFMKCLLIAGAFSVGSWGRKLLFSQHLVTHLFF